MAQHAPGHVTRDLHDRLACAALGKLRDQCMSVIVPPAGDLCISTGSVRGCFELRDAASAWTTLLYTYVYTPLEPQPRSGFLARLLFGADVFLEHPGGLMPRLLPDLELRNAIVEGRRRETRS